MFGIQDSPAAGVRRQASQGLLRVSDGRILIANGLATVVGRSGGAPFAGVPGRWGSNESASINAIKRDVRLIECINRGSQLSLIFNSGSGQTTGEVHQKLLLGDFSKHLSRNFDRRELAI